MHLFGTILAAILLLLVCSFFPGFFFTRRMRWTPLEKLCGSVGLSLILLYLAAWGIYCFGPRDQRPAYWATAGACAVLAALSGRDALRFFRSFRIRQTLRAFGFLVAFTIAMLAMIRVYSGAGWAGDWAEHFQRSIFFLDRLPAQGATFFRGEYALPARPPMQNVLAAYFLGLTADRFEVFQVVFGFLNALMFLPCVLLMPALGFAKRRALIPLAALFAANPAVMENITYTWTKALPAFFVISAVALYLAGLRKDDWVRVAAAFLLLAAGVLTHYSAGPYLVVIGIHYLVRGLRSGARVWRTLPLVAIPGMLLLATWFGWSLRVYGAKVTFASNTSVSTAEPDPVKNTVKVAANIVDTIVPPWLRGEMPEWRQPNVDGRLRDDAFVFYQLNLIFAMGVAGGPLVLWLLYRRLVRGEAGRERMFWRIFVPGCIVLGVAVVGERDFKGVPHLTLLALEALGLTVLAAAFGKLSKPVRLAIVVGCCIDFGLGVYLHARIESLENTGRQTVFTEIAYMGAGRFERTPESGSSLSQGAQGSWNFKHRIEMYEKWLRELPKGNEEDTLFRANWKPLEDEMKAGLEDDAKQWGGWLARHGGVIAHLGDHVGGSTGSGSDLASAVFLALFAGSMWLFVREALTARTAVAPRVLPKKSARARR